MRVIELLIRSPNDEKAVEQAEKIAAQDSSGRTRLQTAVARAELLLRSGDPVAAARIIEEGVPPLVPHDHSVAATYARALNASGDGPGALELLLVNLRPGSQLDWPDRFPLIPTLIEVAANQPAASRRAANAAVALLAEWLSDPAAVVDSNQVTDDYGAMIAKWRTLLDSQSRSAERLADFRRSVASMLPSGFPSDASEAHPVEAAFAGFVKSEPSAAYRELAKNFLASILVRPR